MKYINKKLIIRQEEMSDCGACSLLSIIRYYGGNASLEELRISSLTTNHGVNAYNLIQCAREHGFDATGMNLDSIPSDKLPCIAHVKLNTTLSHFIVIYKIKNDELTIMDPAFGYRKIKKELFNKISTHIYILLTPKHIIKNHINTKSINTILIQLILSKKMNILYILFLNIIFIISSIINSFYISILLKNTAYYIIIMLFINILIYNLIQYLIRNNINKLNNSISNSLINKFYDHIFKLPLNYIHIKDSNEIIKRVMDMDSIKELILSFIINSITCSLIIFIISMILIEINQYLLYFILTMIIGYLLIVIITNKNIGNSINEIISVDTSYNNSLIDYITGLISIKHTNSEKHFKNELSRSHEISNAIKYNYNKHISWQDFLKQSFISSIEFIVNLFIIVNILNGQYGVENLIIINFLFQLIINSVINIGNHIPGLLYHKKIITKINDFYNMVEENDSKERIEKGIISIKDLSFSYNNYNKVLEGINININMKDKIIIKGESGCGKSTLCKILNKEYDNYEGDIYLGNTNYRKLNSKSIRRLISYSSQNEIIFHDTIRNNILMGNKITEKKLNEIVRICELDRVIKKKVHGLDTFLYGGDGELSGGEKQLIILARSLVLTKDILILDETLSEVNDAVEDRVLNNLFTEYKDKMIIYVSHKNKKNYFYKILYV